MMHSAPPLWKDIDAYLQVTEPPNIATILQYAPLYCFSARVPLYLGAAWDDIRAGAALPPLRFFSEPRLTDSGVWLLIIAQHAGVVFASYCAIAAAARAMVLRVVLAGMWALNPLFYIFAHTVASEALSTILLLLIAAVGLRIVQQPARRKRLWIVFALLLTASMLTRHINGVIAALLPLAFGLSAVLRLLHRRGRSWHDLRYAAMATAVGLIAIFAVDATLRLASEAAGIRYHRRVGFSFLFRLNFLARLSPVEREPLLARAAAHARSVDVRRALDALRAMPVTSLSQFKPMTLLSAIRHRLPAAVANSLDDTDEVLNETARSFLVAPSVPYVKAVVADVAQCARTTPTEIVGRLLLSTAIYFKQPETMPKCAGLVTFRATDRREFMSHIYKRRYFAVWKRAAYFRTLLATIAALAVVIGGAARRLSSYAIALLLVGFLTVIGNSVVNEFQPRYALPMWELTIVALTILLPSAVSAVKRRLNALKSASATAV